MTERYLLAKGDTMLKTALLCLALNIYFEARGEPIEGQLAVAHVTINRTKENHSSICSEVFKPGQFQWTRHPYKLPSNKDASWISSQSVAKKSLSIEDVTGGATFFFEKNCRNVKSITTGRRKTRMIGNHLFYANK